MFAPLQSLIVRFLQRVSVETHAWLDLNQTLGVAAGYVPADQFVLFENNKQTCERALALLGLDRECVMAKERTSSRPIHDGYLTLLELTLGKGRATDDDTRQRVRVFFEREVRRDAEAVLRACYKGVQAQELAEHESFRFMDYPAFDNGSGTVDLGLMVIDRDTRYVWSRIAFAHK